MPIEAQNSLTESNQTIVVTICTRKRPRMLEACLRSLLPQLAGAGGNHLVVVENDEVPVTQDLVQQLVAAYPQVNVHYVHEPRLGIPVARNAALEIALALDVDWIGFIDDDETLDQDWLAAMFSAGTTLEADVLTGPVVYEAAGPIPPWRATRLARGRETGDMLSRADTNNTLLRRSWLIEKAPELKFDESLLFTGGSDRDFFGRAHGLGCRIRYVNEAIVKEFVPAERLTPAYHFRHQARLASNEALLYKKRHGAAKTFAHVGSRAIARAIRGFFYVATARLGIRDAATMWKGREILARAKGMTAAMIGRPYQPYKITTGE